MERTLLDHFPNGILILVDHDLRWVVVDGGELARTGRVAADLEGKTIHEIYPPDVGALSTEEVTEIRAKLGEFTAPGEGTRVRVFLPAAA